MAKSKEKESNLSFDETIKMLNKKYNTAEENDQCFYASTGSVGLDMALGGQGLKSKRITELIAWEGSGKTTVCLHAVADCQRKYPNKKAVYIDAEHALDETYARAIGVDWDNLVLFQPMSGEEGFDYAKELMKTGEVSIVIFDSTSGLLPRKQMEDPAGSSNLGLHARLIGQEIPKTQAIASQKNTILIYVSQVREKIGVMFGSPETTQGGNALKFWASNRIELRKSLEKDGDEIIGLNTRFKTLKCKTSKPFQVGSFPITFGVGIDKYKELLEMAKELGLIKVWGKKTTYKEVDYVTDEFIDIMKNNNELFEEIKSKVTNNYQLKVEVNEE